MTENVEREAGAIQLLRRGIAASPELRVGMRFTIAMALARSLGQLVIPVLIQQILDRGVVGEAGFRAGFVYTACAIAAVVVLGLRELARVTEFRLMRAAENTLFGLRTRAFAHLHRLSIADHSEVRKGAMVARVTSDVEALARFAEWGAIAWITETTLIVGTLVVMAVYSWQLTLIVAAVFMPLLPVFRILQRRQLRAYDLLRTRVSENLAEVSEAVTGAAVIRAYGLHDRTRRRLDRAIRNQYKAELGAAKYFAIMFPLGEIFGAIALSATVAAGVTWGPGWGLEVGQLIAIFFLVNLLVSPVAELSEILDQTQTALAGWRKILDLLNQPIDVVEPDPGLGLAAGPLAVDAVDVGFSYRDGVKVLRNIDVIIEAGQGVAIVGETGSGKTTFAKLLCRLADPVTGSIMMNDVPLTDIAADARHAAIRMVPQDGFLFNTTIRENVSFGRPGAGDADVDAAFSALELDWWVERLPDGLHTVVGERGERLSVGERQLVALARAQLADPGLLILDEATSSVDPETEVALTTALSRLAEGRTTVSIAHRLSTAEGADRILVFDRGRIVEDGSHDDLVAAGGVYGRLYDS